MTGKDRTIPVLRQLPTGGAPEQRQPRYPLSVQSPLTLGRDPRCQVVLNSTLHRAVSRRHAEIIPIFGFHSPDGSCYWQICDLNSANGTFLNGQRLKGCQVLQSGDRIMLGRGGPEFILEYLTEKLVGPVPSPEPTPFPPAVNLPPVPTYQSLQATAPSPTDRPSPRDPDAAISLTQLFPILSTGRDLNRKAYLLPAGITISFVVLMFLAVGEPLLFNLLLAAYLAGAAYYFIYQLCGKHKPWWLLTGVAASTMLLLLSPVLDGFIWVFREVLRGQIPTEENAVSFPELLLRMFLGAGLMEELLKVVPLLVLYWLTRQMRSPWRERLGIHEPLDGIILGAASAVGFTLIETLGQYLPEIYQATLSAGEGAAQLASLQLLIPRVLGSVSGHMAYSGYLGYFVGLSVLRPRKRFLILSVGYLTASILHALWNVTGIFSPVLLATVGVLSYAFLGAAILKARELSPTRSQNFATRFYK
jgi:RsiW-degrading membrane proteinase PrsW (M82 family)